MNGSAGYQSPTYTALANGTAGAGCVPFRRYSRRTPDASTEGSSSFFTLNFEIAQAGQHSFAVFNIPDLKPRCQSIALPVRI